METIILEIKEIKDWLCNNINVEGELSSVQQALLTAIVDIIPQLQNYEEEDRKIRFKLAVGFQTTPDKIDGRVHKIRTIQSPEGKEDEEYIDNLSAQITSVIKDLASLCVENADMYIVENKDKIEVGVYYTDIVNTGDTEKSFLNNSFIVIQEPVQKMIEIKAKDDAVQMCFYFGSKMKSIGTMMSAEPDLPTICKIWEGIFKKVKKAVHGTICLIVDEEWTYANDHNFKKDSEDLKINIPHNPKNDVDMIQEMNVRIELLINMMNSDGITVIDTNANIRAYHLFCEIDKGLKVQGGARHRAYEQLKNLPQGKREHYVAVYFQSQEGEIKYYNYVAEQEKDSFDPSVMNGGSVNQYYTLVKDHFDKNKLTNSGLPDSFTEIDETANKLMDAHLGFNNFYNEPKPAESLNKLLVDDEIIAELNNNDYLRYNVLNAIFNCYVGNNYGVSWDAETFLIEMIRRIDSEAYKKYFEEEEFLEINLLWAISGSKPFGRWRMLIDMLSEEKQLVVSDTIMNYSTRDYSLMYDELAKIIYS